MRSDFAVFILTHGRPDRITTLSSLKRCGYTGNVYLIIDDEDDKADQYFGSHENVIQFSKSEIAQEFDEGDNFSDRRTITYARNAAFKIAAEMGLKYFIQLDDDYSGFYWKLDGKLSYQERQITSLDAVWGLMLKFYESCPQIKTIAMSQNGDFIGGKDSRFGDGAKTKRKAMNSFICTPDRPLTYIGRMNEDVNTYTTLSSRGAIFLTINHVSLIQATTQAGSGGITELYESFGTYVKSFYTVMMQPSSVKINMMGKKSPRIHHRVSWRKTAPKILRDVHAAKQ